MEKLFSKEDIYEIEKEALDNFEWYHNAHVLDGKSNERSIKTISKNKELIIVEGNDDTGFKHFNNRHSYFSFKNYWTPNDTGYRLDDPSKFHQKMIPIIDYVKIAEAIFTPENKNITKNNRPDFFDKYTGVYTNPDSSEAMFHMLTYKGTKIIHTMFPEKKKYNVKNKTKYAKGIVTSKLKIAGNENYNDLLIPYENHLGIAVYSILIRKFYNEKIERLIIQKHDEEGTPYKYYIIGSRNFENFESFSKENTFTYQNADITELEKLITKIDNEDKILNLSSDNINFSS